MPTKLKDFVEDFCANFATSFSVTGGRTYTLATNMLIGDHFDVQDIGDIVGSDIDLAVYEENGTLIRGSRFDQVERVLRFVVKDSYRQGAVNHAHDIFQ